jgi:PAS domain S-box-containing protein
MFLKTQRKNNSLWCFLSGGMASLLFSLGMAPGAVAGSASPLGVSGLFLLRTQVTAENNKAETASSFFSLIGTNILAIQILAMIVLVVVLILLRKKTIQREQGRAKEQFRERETRFDKILNNVIDGIITTDENGNIEIFNPAAERIFGYKSSEVEGKNIDFLMPVSFYENTQSLRQAFENAGGSLTHGVQRELTGLKKDGSTFPMEFYVSEIFLENRQTFTALVHDITERKKQEEALKLESAYVRLLHDVSSAANEAKNFEQAIQTCLDKICALTGWALGHLFLPTTDSPPNLTSTNIWCLDDLEKFSKFQAVTDATTIHYGEELAGRVLATGEHTWVRDIPKSPLFQQGRFSKDMEIVSGFAFPVLIGREVVGVMEFFSTHPVSPDQRLLDVVVQIGTQLGRVVERQRSQDEIIQAREKAYEAQREADHANQTKSEFLANMSHEIRTPMNAIIGMSDMLVETELNSEQQQLVDVFRGAGENLLTLIDDILDLSKIEAGQIELDNMDFNPRALVEKNIDILDLKAQEKGLKLYYHLAPDVPGLIHGDSHRLRQVLTNLIGNAIKFTEQGEILVRVEKDPDAENLWGLLFSVIDTGVGIPSEKLESIFTSFSQADSSTTRKYGGTGLGLTICKRLVGLMDGTIWAESKVGQGSAFHFTVQFDKPLEPVEIPTVMPEKLRGVKVLLIEQRASVRSMVNDQLVNWGMKVRCLNNSQEGLKELKTKPARENPYQLLLINSRLPTIGGFRFLNQVLMDIKLHIPTVMMMPIDTRKGDIDQCRKLGVVDYMTKFVQPEILLEKIYAAMGYKSLVKKEMPEKGIEPHPETGESLEILLVEDSEDNRLLVQLYLSKTMHQLETAENGEVALEMFQKKRYDLVLMDMQMPVMDGYTATGKIREWEDRQNREPTPIVALTSNALKGDMEKCLKAGCSGYVSKPIKKGILLDTLEKYSPCTKSRMT